MSPGIKHKLAVVSAFAAIYVIWGSTYLAIRLAIATMPPFLMAGCRFTIAGCLMYLWSWWRKAESPRPVHWRSAAVIGTLFLLGGNGCVVFAEQSVPSGLVSLLVSVVPIWVALLDWLRPQGVRPGPLMACGLALGVLGLFVLTGPSVDGGVNVLGALVVIFGSFCWSLGTVLSRQFELPASAVLATAMEMICGGLAMVLVGLLTGEVSRLHAGAFSLESLGALAYLIAFGSIIGYSAYVWLIQVENPTKVSTYAYVNPLVALFLGWSFAGEKLEARTFIAAALILAAVAMVTKFAPRPSAKRLQPLPEEVL